MTTEYSIDLVKNQAAPGMSTGFPDQPKDLAELEEKHRKAAKELAAAVAAFPAEKLSDELELPWGTMSFLQCIGYAYWNMMYHYGQIGYIQTMYGDTEFH